MAFITAHDEEYWGNSPLQNDENFRQAMFEAD